jgi:hypothetical protein
VGGRPVATTLIEGDIEDAPHAINFVLHDEQYNQWYHSTSGDFFRVPCPAIVPEPVGLYKGQSSFDP